MRACAKVAGISLVLIAMLASCDILGVKLDNPADPNSPNYQGYTNVDHVNLVVPMAPSGDLSYPPTLYASKVIGGSAYRFQISANESFNVIETEVEQATNVFAPSAWVPSLGAGNYHFRVQAKKDGAWGPWSRSQIFTLQSKGIVATPAFSLAAGNYGSTQAVTLSCATSGALMRYTTDGSNPSVTAGTLYSAPVQVASSMTLKAVAYLPGWTTSQIASAAYSVNGAALPPVFSPGTGSYTSGRNVTISSETAGASIRYTTDGSTPSETAGTLYASPVAINSSTTLKAIAYKEGWLPSTVTSGAFVITGTVASPVISPAGGSFTAAQQVSITSLLDGASIRYTLDGSNPSSTAGTLYTAPFTVSSSSTVKAVAYKADWLDSAIASASFTITGTVASPTFSPAAGTYTSAQSVTIATNPSDATIRYTLDGSNPSENYGLIYTEAITVTSSMSIKAVAYKKDWSSSQVSNAQYLIIVSVPEPKISLAEGTYNTSKSVSLTCDLNGAVIRYTIDGSIPSNSNGIIYSEPILIERNTVLKAIAYRSDLLNSSIVSASYVISKKVFYNGNGNTGGIAPIDSSYYVFNDIVTVKENSERLVKDGYNFACWNTAADGNGSDYLPGTSFIMPVDNVIFYAKWRLRPSYTITYNGNGNTSGLAPADEQIYYENDTIIVKKNTGLLANDYYAFKCWNTKSDGTGVDVYGDSTIIMGTKNIVLYAKWHEPRLGDAGPAGGLIFYDKGIFTNGWRYLEAIKFDLSTGIIWNNGIMTNTNLNDVGDGKKNTIDIVAKTGLGSYAAKLCSDFELNGYKDWYLPSNMELNKIFYNIKDSGNVIYTCNWYWSSSEMNDSYVWAFNFISYQINGLSYAAGGSPTFYKSAKGGVIAVRSF